LGDSATGAESAVYDAFESPLAHVELSGIAPEIATYRDL
jgi:hypothetical protein